MQLTVEYPGNATDMASLPAFGIEWELPGEYDRLRYYYGGEETYRDRKQGGKLGIWDATAKASMAPYLMVQETGSHEDVRWLEATDIQGHGLRVTQRGDRHFTASLLPWNTYMIEAARRHEDLPEPRHNYLRLLAASRWASAETTPGEPRPHGLPAARRQAAHPRREPRTHLTGNGRRHAPPCRRRPAYDAAIEATGAAADGTGEEAFERAGHAVHGTTRQVLSLITNPMDVICRNIRTVREKMATRPDILGCHLEGRSSPSSARARTIRTASRAGARTRGIACSTPRAPTSPPASSAASARSPSRPHRLDRPTRLVRRPPSGVNSFQQNRRRCRPSSRRRLTPEERSLRAAPVRSSAGCDDAPAAHASTHRSGWRTPCEPTPFDRSHTNSAAATCTGRSTGCSHSPRPTRREPPRAVRSTPATPPTASTSAATIKPSGMLPASRWSATNCSARR